MRSPKTTSKVISLICRVLGGRSSNAARWRANSVTTPASMTTISVEAAADSNGQQQSATINRSSTWILRRMRPTPLLLVRGRSHPPHQIQLRQLRALVEPACSVQELIRHSPWTGTQLCLSSALETGSLLSYQPEQHTINQIHNTHSNSCRYL